MNHLNFSERLTIETGIEKNYHLEKSIDLSKCIQRIIQ